MGFPQELSLGVTVKPKTMGVALVKLVRGLLAASVCSFYFLMLLFFLYGQGQASHSQTIHTQKSTSQQETVNQLATGYVYGQFLPMIGLPVVVSLTLLRALPLLMPQER